MKNTFMKFIAATLLLVAGSPLWARAEKTDAVRNAAAMTIESQVATNDSSASNAVAATETSHKRKMSSDADHPPVRIDGTGVHVGGVNPVDIAVPDFVRYGGGGGFVAILAMLVPIVAILAPFIFIVAVVGIKFYFGHRRSRMLHETLRAMVDKGVPITPELIAQLKGGSFKGGSSKGSKTGGLRSGLLPGLVLTGVGTALLITGPGHSTWGWIVLFIGVAFLIVWFVERKNQNNVQPPQ
jgi:Flp pilus assembly protein TadB